MSRRRSSPPHLEIAPPNPCEDTVCFFNWNLHSNSVFLKVTRRPSALLQIRRRGGVSHWKEHPR